MPEYPVSIGFGIWRAIYALAQGSNLLLWWGIRHLMRRPPSMGEVGVRFRTALETLGVTYVKLGQFLAMRFDLLPVEICDQLSRLFDAVPPVPQSEVRRVLEAELGAPVESLFADFDWECVAAASVAQVHRARLSDGTIVAVKVQRPRAREIFFADIRNLRSIAAFVDWVLPIGAISLAEGVREFEIFTAREMDFEREAQTSEQVRRNAGAFEAVPAVFWHLTRMRVLTMEFELGVPASRVIQLREEGREAELEALLPGLDLVQCTHRLAQACFRQFFEDGFFHADPHPGNIFIRRDGTIAFLDFGIFGDLPKDEQGILSRFVESAALGDVPGTYHQFAKLLAPRERTELALMQRDMTSVIYRWIAAVGDLSTPPADRHFAKYVNQFLAEARRHGTGMSLDSLLFWRALITFNGTGLRLNPDLDVVGEISGFFRGRALTTVWHRWTQSCRASTPPILGTGQPVSRHASASAWRAECRLDASDRRRTNAQAGAAASVILAVVFAAAALALPEAAGVCIVGALVLSSRALLHTAIVTPSLPRRLRRAFPGSESGAAPDACTRP